jgi:hypothetical protein
MDFGRAASTQAKAVHNALMNSHGATGLVQAYDHLFLALYEETQAKRMAQHTLKSKFVVVPCVHFVETNGCEQFVPSPLQEIYRFDELANQASRQNAGLRLVFCAGLNPALQARVAFLLGCHMLISLEMDPGTVYAIFRKQGCIGEGLLAGWWALLCAKTMGWINFQDHFQLDDADHETIQMDEYLHYSRLKNEHSLPSL